MALGGGIELPTIRQRITVDDSALGGIGAKFRGVAGTLGTAVAAGAGVAAAAVGAFVASGVKGAIDVQRGVREVVTLFGETGEAAQALEQELTAGVRALSDEVGIAQDVITGGLYQAISAGVPKENAFEFLRVASEASIAGVTDVETAVDGLTTTINAFGLDASQAGEVADSMFAAVQGGKTTFEELSSALFNVAPVAADAGVSFEHVNAAIATLTAAGTPTSVATTQMRQALVELSKPGNKVADLFTELSGKTFRDFTAAGGTVEEALGILGDHAAETGVKVGDLFGSVEAAGAISVLAGTGAEKFSDELERQAGAAGSAGDAFDTMNETTGRAWEQFKVGLQNVAIGIGSTLLPPLTRMLNTIAGPVTAAVEKFSWLLGAVLEGDLWGVAEVIDNIFGNSGRFVTPIRTSLETVTGIFASFRPWIASTMESIKEIIGGVLEVVSVLWNLWGDDILVFVKSTFTAIKQVISGVLRIIKGVIDTVLGVLTGDWSRAWDGIKNIVGGVWDVIRGIVTYAVGRVRAIVGAAFDLLRTIVRNAWDGISGAVSTGISNVMTWLYGLPGRIRRAVSGMGSLLWSAGRDLLEGMIRGITSMTRRLADAAMAPVRNAVSKVKGFLGLRSPSRLFMDFGRMTGEGLAIGLQRSTGQVAAAGASLANAAARPFPARVGATAAASGGARGTGGVSQQNTFHVTAFDPAEAARKLGREQVRAMHLVPAGG